MHRLKNQAYLSTEFLLEFPDKASVDLLPPLPEPIRNMNHHCLLVPGHVDLSVHTSIQIKIDDSSGKERRIERGAYAAAFM